MQRLLVLIMSLTVLAAGAVLADSEIDRVKAEVHKALPDLPLDKVEPSPVPGLYQIEVESQIIYVSAGGRYLVMGNVIDLETKENLTEARRAEIMTGRLKGIDEKTVITMAGDHPKRTITVFTDVDCSYCARFHLDTPELIKNGVRIRYLFYPRAGLASESYKRSVAVWCAEDRVKAIGIAKAGGKLVMKNCPNPVADHFLLGQRIGVSGTPTIILDTGHIAGGYLPPAKLLSILGLGKS